MADAPLDRVELETSLDLVEVVTRLRRALEQHLRDDGGLTYVQFQILASLGDADGGTRRMTELADGIVVSRSGLTYQVDLLEGRGLVVRAAAEDDERGVTVTVTPAGRDLVAGLLPRHVAITRALLLDPLDRDQVVALGALLRPVRDHLRATPARVRGARS